MSQPGTLATLYPDAHVAAEDELRPARVPSRLHPVPEMPMPVDPDPHVPDLLLAAAARLGFWTLGRDPQAGEDLGGFGAETMTYSLLVVRGPAPGSVEWQLVALTSAPARFPRWLVTRATYEVLHTGRPSGDGGVVCGGVAYRLVMESNGDENIATARRV